MHHPCTHAMPCHAPVLSLSLSCLLVSLVRTRKCPCQLPGGRAPLYCGSCFSAQRHAQCRSQQSPAVPSLGGTPSVGGCRALLSDTCLSIQRPALFHHSPIFSRIPIARVSQGSLGSKSPASTDHRLTGRLDAESASTRRIGDSRQTHAMPLLSCRRLRLAATCSYIG
jgi:hypothetical protein